MRVCGGGGSVFCFETLFGRRRRQLLLTKPKPDAELSARQSVGYALSFFLFIPPPSSKTCQTFSGILGGLSWLKQVSCWRSLQQLVRLALLLLGRLAAHCYAYEGTFPLRDTGRRNIPRMLRAKKRGCAFGFSKIKHRMAATGARRWAAALMFALVLASTLEMTQARGSTPVRTRLGRGAHRTHPRC